MAYARSLERTDAALRKVAERILPNKGILGSVMLAGFDGPSQTLAPNAAAAYFPLKSFEERKALGVSFDQILNEARANVADITEARVIVIPPPLIQGIGSAGGYRMMVQDRGGHGYQKLAEESGKLIGKANQTEGLAQVFTFFDTGSPRVYADIDRAKLATTRAEAGEQLSAQQIVRDLILAYWDLLFASRDEVLECVLVRSDGEAVAINLDIEPVEKPETVLWVDPIHRDPAEK